MIAHAVEQRSEAWRQLRAGRLTASAVADLYATRKDKKEAAARRDLRFRLAMERITGASCEEPFSSPDTERGEALEPAARAAYEATTGSLVEEVGFVSHDELPIGCSPDGLVGTDGIVQIKCPRPATHFVTLESRVVPEDYVPQLVHELWVTGRAWADFVSYCPQMPEPGRCVVLRYVLAESELAAHQMVVAQFLREVEETEASIRKAMGV